MPKQIFHSICFSENEHSWSINHLSIAHLKPGNQSQSIKITTRRNSSTLITITYSLHGRAVGTGGTGGQWLPKFLADHKRGGGADYAHQITTRPPSPRIFRPSYGPARPHCTVSSLCKLLHVHSKQCHIYGTPRTSIFIQRSEKNTSPSIRSLDLHGHIAT